MERLNLRIPSLERLRLSAVLEAVRSSIGGDRDRAVLFGSSLGGLTACRVAESDARVCALVLLAPALNFTARWRAKLGEEKWKAWEETGWLETYDHADGTMTRVDFGFAKDVEEVEARAPSPWPDVRVPTLILHGARDEVVDVQLSRDWSAGKRHVRLIEVDDDHELAASIPLIVREADAFLAPLLGGA
jgi:pimeloyl-ACP methyl ester carboxylesterase